MTVQDICVAFFLIPQHEFDEAAAHELIATLTRRIEDSNFAHRNCAVEAIESLGDAATVMENAAEEIRAENCAEVG